MATDWNDFSAVEPAKTDWSEFEVVHPAQSPTIRSLISKVQQAGAALAGNVIVNPLEAGPKAAKALSYPLESISAPAGEMLVDFLNRTGIDPSARTGQPIGGEVKRLPIATIPGTKISPLDIISPEIRKGIEAGAGKVFNAIRMPETVATLPAAELKPVQALYAASAAGSLPESVEAVSNSKTAKERADAATQAAANFLLARQLAKGGFRKEPTGAPQPSEYQKRLAELKANRQAAQEAFAKQTEAPKTPQEAPAALPPVQTPPEAEKPPVAPLAAQEPAVSSQETPVSTEKPTPTEPTPAPQSAPESGVKKEGAAVAGEPEVQPATMTGAAHVSEIPEISQTGLKNAVGDMERVGLGLQDAPETVRRNMAGAWEQAGQIEKEKPGTGANLAAMLGRDPDMGLTDTESALLLRHKTDLWNKMNDAAERSHVGDATARAKAQAEHDVYAAEFGQLLDATRVRGREWGREGRWRQAMSQDDFTFSSVDELNTYRRSSTGRDLTEEQKLKAERIAGENKKAQGELATASENLNKRIRQKKSSPEQDALDAASKTVRENAIRLANAENKERLAKTHQERELANTEKQRVQVALDEATKRTIAAAIQLARQEREVKPQSRLTVQEEAAQRALIAASNTVRAADERMAKAETRDSVADQELKNSTEQVQKDAEQDALDATSKTVRTAAVQRARLENRKRLANAVKEKKLAAAERAQSAKAKAIADKKVRDEAVKLAREAQKRQADPSIAVWELANKYLEENKGFYGFDDLRNKIAVDLKMTPSQVTRWMARDPRAKQLADDLWTKQRNARRLKEQAKIWVRELDTPGYIKALASIPRAMFNLSVFGHGFVALGTHAPIVAFQPRFWNAYVRNFGKMYKMVFSPAYYEAQMQDLVRRPNYEKFRRAGLQNDPFKYEEFHTTMVRDMVKSWIGEKNMQRVDNVTSAGNRGYGVLKLLRQDMADQKYGKLPDSIRKQDGVLESLSDDINHATGVTRKQAPQGSNLLLFAPRLAGSRVMWLGGDPIRAARAIADWKNAPESERQFAINQVKEKAWVFGTFASILAANQGFLSASGSNQKINGIPQAFGGAGFDPLASDFMKFKAAGGDIAYGGALLTMAKLPVRIATAILYDGKGSKYILEDERVDKVIGSYIRSQAAPFAGTVADLALGRDYQERPLPAKMFGTVEQTGAVPKRLQAQGVDEPYNWAEFTATKLPIPIAEGIKEGLRGAGMPEGQLNYWLRALAISSLMTGTGTRITEDTREEQ